VSLVLAPFTLIPNTENVPRKVPLTITANSSRFPRIGRLLLALCAFGGFALADSVDTLTVTAIDWSQGGNPWLLIDGVNRNTDFVGVIDIVLSQNGVDYPRETMCADLFTEISLGSYNNLVTMPSAITPTSRSGKDLLEVSWLIDNVMLPYLSNGGFTSALPSAYWLSPGGTSAYTGAELGEALQMTIWDLTVDGGDGLSSGLVQEAPGLTPQTPIDIVTYFEQAAYGKATNNAYVYVNWSQIDGSPAQMLEGPLYFDNGPTPIAPEPATFVLVGVALIGAGWFWRRRMRKPGSCAA